MLIRAEGEANYRKIGKKNKKRKRLVYNSSLPFAISPQIMVLSRRT